MEAKAPSLCRLCDVSLSNAAEWREHAKSDWHVYNLRKRHAQPGTVVTPPSGLPHAEATTATERHLDTDTMQGEEGSGDEVGEDEDTEISPDLEFDPGQCLFCSTEQDSFDENLAHMSKTHGFVVPFQDLLTVDLDVLIEYLHLVIYGYGECILCGARRRTVEGIQHHMTAKGHGRFDVASDIAEFYDLPESGYQADEESLRLPSGRLISHRTRAIRPSVWKKSRQPSERRTAHGSTGLATAPSAPGAQSQGRDVATAPPPPEATRAQLMSGLTRGDQQSLAHLPDHEVRSLLASSAKQIDQARREETRSQLRLEKAENSILMGNFRMDTSKRFRGPWG